MARCAWPRRLRPQATHYSRPTAIYPFNIGTTATGTPVYDVTFKGEPVVGESTLGLVADEFKFTDGLAMTVVATDSVDETWQPVWGETADIRNNYNEVLVSFADAKGLTVNVRARAFDDGVGSATKCPSSAASTMPPSAARTRSLPSLPT